MRSSRECTAKALELDGRAEEAPTGPIRDGFALMADNWRQLSSAAAKKEEAAPARPTRPAAGL